MYSFIIPTSFSDLHAAASDAVNAVAKAATENPVTATVAGTVVVGLATMQAFNMAAPTLDDFAKSAKAKIHEWTAEPVRARKVSVSAPPAAAMAA